MWRFLANNFVARCPVRITVETRFEIKANVAELNQQHKTDNIKLDALLMDRNANIVDVSYGNPLESELKISTLNVIVENEKLKSFFGNFYVFLHYLIIFHVCINTIDQIIPQYQ